MKMSLLGEKFYHIDIPNGIYEVVKCCNSIYYYAVYFHPAFGDIKSISKYDIGKKFFRTFEEMSDARIARAKRQVELEITCKERKI